MNYKFDHSKESMPECMGIAPERNTKIIALIEASYEATEDCLRCFEHALEAIQPESEVEAAYIGYGVLRCYQFHNQT